jgi:type IV pilus assembly protein PilN
MRVPVNLASEPFRRDRPMIAASIGVGVLLAGVLCMLVYLAIAERDRAKEARQSIARTEAALKSVAQQKSRIEAMLRQQQNAEVLDRSVFINGLLLRKGVSWTRIFADLEQVTPANVRLITVRPQINTSNELLLDMVVGSQSVESILTFVQQLEGSNVFSKANVHTTLPPSQTDPLFRGRVSVNYAQKL